jgi:hypothetical protein
MPFIRFYWRWVVLAFTGAWGIVGAFSTLAGILLAALADKNPDWVSPNVLRVLNSLGGWIIPLALFSSVLAIRLMLAPYWLYKQRERELEGQLVAARSELQSSQAPQLEGTVIQPITGDFSGTRNGHPISGVIFVLTVELRNTGGKPTSVRAWRLQLRGNGIDMTLQPTHVTRTTRIGGAQNPITLIPGEAIYEKTSEPISPGQFKRGWIYFQAEGIQQSRLRRATKTLSCLDTHGNEILFVDAEFEDDDGVPRYFPGTTPVVKQPWSTPGTEASPPSPTS